METKPVVMLVAGSGPFGAEKIRSDLHAAGFSVAVTQIGEVNEALLHLKPALIIANLSDSQEADLALCRRLSSKSDAPIIAIGESGDVDFRTYIIEANVDDFLTRPVNPPELTARVKAILRRTQPSQTISQKAGRPVDRKYHGRANQDRPDRIIRSHSEEVEAMKKKSSKKWVIIIGILIVVVVAGVIVVPRVLAQSAAANQSAYQTVAAEKGDLTAYVGATGTVRSNQSATLSWQTSGKVSVINIEKNQVVTADTTLAELDQTSLSPNLILAQAQLASDKKALDDLLNSQAPSAQARQAVDTAQKALDDYINNFPGTQAQAQKALADAQDALTSAKNKSASMNTIHGTQAQIAQAQADILSLQDQIDKAQTAFDKVSGNDLTDLRRANALANLENLQAKLTTATYNLNYLQGTPTAEEIAQADAELAQAQAQLATAQYNWDRVKDGPNPTDQAILAAQLSDAQRAYDRVKNGPNQDDVAAAQAKVASDMATLNQAALKAPFGGTITVIESKTGDLVSPGTLAFQIDDLSHLYVDIDVSEVDIARVQLGQPASLTFDAIQDKTFNGVVTDISSVGTVTGGAVNFTVTVEITDKTDEIKPGMTAAANIAVSQLSDVLLVPNRAIRTQDSTRIVYILKNGVATPVEITLGALSNTQSEVTGGGLQVGDEIILNPPSASLLGGGGLFGRGG